MRRGVPVTVDSHTYIPHAISAAPEALTVRAICSAEGGFDSGFRFAGSRTAGAGLYEIQPHRTAAANAPPIIACTDRTVDAAYGLH